MLTKNPILDCVRLSEIKRKQLKGERHGLGYSNCNSHVFVENNYYPIGEFQIYLFKWSTQQNRNVDTDTTLITNQPRCLEYPYHQLEASHSNLFFFLQMINGLICMIFWNKLSKKSHQVLDLSKHANLLRAANWP